MNLLLLFDVAPDPENLALAGAVLIGFIIISFFVLACIILAIVLITRAIRKKKNQNRNPQEPFQQ